MKEGRRVDEIREISNLILVICIAGFSLALSVLNIVLGWERWIVPLFAVSVLLCIYFHVTGIFSGRFRTNLCSGILMVEMFYYSVNVSTLNDAASVIIAMMILFAMNGEKWILRLGMATGYFGMLYHLFDDFASGYVIITFEYVVRVVWLFFVVFAAAFAVSWLVSGRDRVEKKYKERVEILEAQNKSAADFLANVSHEIRTPVNAVVGLAKVALELEQDPEIKKDLENVEEAGLRITQQIGDILDYSEIDMGRLCLNNEDYMPVSMVNDLMAELSPFFKKEVELVVDIDPKLPLMMHSDVGMIRKILWHLVSNALKFTREGGVYLKISSLTLDYGINLQIEVTDTGIGMSDSERERIFEKFYQADSGRSRSSQGLGLGMSIVFGFIRMLGGFITVESSEGKGTTVCVSLPQKVIDSSPSMSVDKDRDISVAVFIHMEKFEHPMVREFYDSTITNLACGLNIRFHYVDNVKDLKKLVSSDMPTHLFVGELEYEEAFGYLDVLSLETCVIVVANEDYTVSYGSKVIVLKKPFFGIPAVGLLDLDKNSIKENKGHMMCNGVKALVVDDEPMNITVAFGIFKRYGMEVSSAESGQNAIDKCVENDYDIIFMDHMMPGMDGIETLRRIRSKKGRRNADTPIVALTANAVSAARDMFRQEGFDGFVKKPIELSELERNLKKVLPKEFITYAKDDVNNEHKTSKASDDPDPNNPGLNDLDSKERSLYDKLLSGGVDYRKALHYCAYDEELYRSLLERFVEEKSQKTDDLERYFNEDDLKNYAIVVHALKSNAKMIGALDLSEMARELESAAKEDRKGIIQRNKDDMNLEYERVADVVAKALGIEGEGVASKEFSVSDEILEFAPGEV